MELYSDLLRTPLPCEIIFTGKVTVTVKQNHREVLFKSPMSGQPLLYYLKGSLQFGRQSFSDSNKLQICYSRSESNPKLEVF